MTKEELFFKENYPEYVTEEGECLSPYWDLFRAGVICDTFELNNKIAELELKIKKMTQHLEPQEMTALFEQVEEEVEQEQRIKKLEAYNEKLLDGDIEKHNKIVELQKENAELKEEIKKWKDEWQEQVQKENDESYARTLQTIQLNKAKKIISNLYAICKDNHYPNTSVLIEQAEQFLKENK